MHSTSCPTGDGNPCQPGQSLCLECVDRLYSELRWLAACYPQLLPALTNRVNVEGRVDRDKVVIVSGGGDPLKSGLDLHEDALQLRATIRRLTYQGLGWLLERGYTRTEHTQEVGRVLAEIARNLHWILSDQDPDRITGWAGMLIAARLEAEYLITPVVQVRKVWTNQECGQGPDGDCPGDLVIWGSEPVARCQINPQHTVSRETLIFRLVTGKLQRS